jgi:hypothetical protein
MGWRGTAALVVIAVVLGIYLWVEEPPGANAPRSAGIDILEAPQRAPTTPAQPLLKFTPAEVTGIRLEHDGRTVEAERGPGGWRSTDPPGAIDDFLHNLEQLAVLSKIPATANDLKDFGLEPAQSILQLRVRGREPLVLQIGDRNPATTGVYVRVGDGPVVLAGALVEWEFEKAFRALSAPPES